MANEIIQIGNKIEMREVVRLIQSADLADQHVYVSQFLHWEDKNLAAIAVPSYKGHMVQLRVDDVFELRFFTKSGLYRCRGKIVKRDRSSGNIAIALVRFVSALEKYQRRQFYRMDCIMPVTYASLTKEQRELYKEKKRSFSQEHKASIDKKLESQEIDFQKGVILDISGGGVRFNSSVQQEPESVLLLEPAFPEIMRKRIPYLFGRVISSRKIEHKEPLTFDNRIEFTDITSAEQEQIITYIFKEERDKRKRESDMK